MNNDKDEKLRDGSADTGENERGDGRRSTDFEFRGNSTALFIAAAKLICLTVVLYVLLNHIDVIGQVLGYIYQLLSPLRVGGLIALILNTPMVALSRLLGWTAKKLHLPQKKRVIEIISLVLTFLLAILLIYIIADTIIPQIGETVKLMYQKIQQKLPEFINTLDKLETYGINTDPLVDWLTSVDINQLITQFSNNAMTLIGKLVSGASSIISGTFTAVSAIVFAIYILSNKRTLSRQLKKLSYAYLKKSFVDHALDICTLTTTTFSHFISGQCLEAVLLGTMFFVSMTIFGFPYALTISALITVTAIVPYVGTFLGGAVGVLLIVIDDPIRALLFLVLFIVVQQIENHLIYPRVVGGSVGLPAIWTFAAVIVGGGLWGVLGMVLFIPLFSVVYTLIRRNVYARLKKRGISAQSLDGGEVVEVKEEKEEKNARKNDGTFAEKMDKLLAKLVSQKKEK